MEKCRDCGRSFVRLVSGQTVCSDCLERRLARRSPFVRRALAHELPAKALVVA